MLDKEQWDEIFRAGEHVDSTGVRHSFSEADLDRIVAGYDPAKHEAPLTIGHPKDNAPAYGWVEKLRRVGASLQAKYRQVAPEFAEWVRAGRFRKKSISLYKDGSLRHVGYLGAQPPAIKGLADFAFSSGDQAVEFEFTEVNAGAVRRLLQRLRDFIIEKFGLETADKVAPAWEIDNVETESVTPSFAERTEPMSREKDLEDKLQAETQKNADLGAQFAEARSKLAAAEARAAAAEAKAAALEAAAANAAAAQRKAENRSFCESLVKEGKLRPADMANTLAFMETLAGAGEIDFAEGEKTGRKPALDAFKAYLAAQPRLVEFGERNAAGVTAGSAADRLEQLTRKKMRERKDLSYAMAFAEAQLENPELAQQYVVEMKQ